MNQQIMEFLEASQKVSSQLQTLVECEQEKRQALLRGEGDIIETLVQSQQAMAMKLDSLEKKRYAAQSAAGFGTQTAREILETAEPEAQTVLRPVLEELTHFAQHLQSLNQVSMDIAATELRLMEQSQKAGTETVQGLYTAGGKSGSFTHNGSNFQEKI